MSAEFAKSVLRVGIFFRLATEPRVRIWSGPGDFAVPADFIEYEGGTYIGVGALLDIPVLDQLVNGVASRLDFSLSVVGDTDLMRLADEDADTVRGSDINIGLMPLGDDEQPVGAMVWVWEGQADTVTIESRLDGDRRVETMTISAGSLFTGRRRPNYRHYTDQEQRKRSPDDRLCDRVTLYSQQYNKTWPRF